MMSKGNNSDDPNNTEELEEGSRSILLGIASQLTKGMDLVRYAFPLFATPMWNSPIAFHLASSNLANFCVGATQYAWAYYWLYVTSRVYSQVSHLLILVDV